MKPLEELVPFETYDSSRTRSEEEIQAYIPDHIRPKIKFKV